MALFPFPQNCVVQSVPAGSTSYNILESSLAPSQDYQVKVRALVAPGDNFSYEGIPSEWSRPADWTSREGKKKKKKKVFSQQTWEPIHIVDILVRAIRGCLLGIIVPPKMICSVVSVSH